jgi:hypothetical protein
MVQPSCRRHRAGRSVGVPAAFAQAVGAARDGGLERDPAVHRDRCGEQLFALVVGAGDQAGLLQLVGTGELGDPGEAGGDDGDVQGSRSMHRGVGPSRRRGGPAQGEAAESGAAAQRGGQATFQGGQQGAVFNAVHGSRNSFVAAEVH